MKKMEKNGKNRKFVSKLFHIFSHFFTFFSHFFRLSGCKKGVSLPIVTGLVALLMVSSAAINQLIIESILSVRRVESSNRAYLAAEAGLEDALYEMTAHLAGYSTPPLTDNDEVRRSDFADPDGPIQWETKWEINGESGIENWSGCSDPDTCLAPPFTENRKLNIYLYNDTTESDSITSEAINERPTDLDVPVGVQNINITFKLPQESITSGNSLAIDNDGDDKFNEDGPDDSAICDINANQEVQDADCDNLFDEDGPDDQLILWKLTDGVRTLNPTGGCIVVGDNTRSQICESNFNNANSYSITLTPQNEGQLQTESGTTTMSILDFINSELNSDKQLQFEFIIVGELEHCDQIQGNGDCTELIEIPELEYDVVTDVEKGIPLPFQTINSDGWYQGFKQSLSTAVLPRTSVPLFDFTIIQQE